MTIKIAIPNLDIFVDKLSLQTGKNWKDQLKQHAPNKDIFYLFWSSSAKESKWVTKEWKMALKERGISYISPVPLEDVRIAPPPTPLKSLHFSDIYASYILSEKPLKKQLSSDK